MTSILFFGSQYLIHLIYIIILRLPFILQTTDNENYISHCLGNSHFKLSILRTYKFMIDAILIQIV